MSTTSEASNSSKGMIRMKEVLEPAPEVPYRLYRWRFVGMIGMVLLFIEYVELRRLKTAQMTLNIAAGMNTVWFGPITNKSTPTFRSCFCF
jgi:hypothetical protein